MPDFNDLKRNLKKDFSSMPTIRCALIADSTVQLLIEAIRGQGYEEGLSVVVSDYTIGDVFNPYSPLYIDHDYIILFFSAEKLQETFYKAESKGSFYKTKLNEYQEIVTRLMVGNTNILIYTLREINDGIFGNYATKTPQSFLYHLRKINEGIISFAQTRAISLLDFNLLQIDWAGIHFYDPKFDITAGMVLSIESLPYIAKSTVDLIKANRGNSYKCIVLDLDNTLWGGIIGEDGIEKIQIGSLGVGRAYSLFQLWLKQLKERGILLAVCSKNDEVLALQAFDHPDMVLKKDDFAVFIANWENKAANIQHIRAILNISFDSMIFLDDNPFERHLLRELLPEVCVPEMPEDPAEYIPFLASLNLFETVGISENDKERTKQYHDAVLRSKEALSFSDYKDYLKSLGMVAEVKEADTFSIPRIAQLAKRSNQFNLRSVRYTETDLGRLLLSEDYRVLSISLKDKFGDYGLIAYVVLQKQEGCLAFIENWAMSCRVLQRGLEDFVLHVIVTESVKMSCKKLVGEYLPNTKNSLVAHLYEQLGFEKEGDFWKLSLDNYIPKTHFINLN